ncbi:MAG: nucleotidyltransferase family protein [bacterium]
MTQTGRDTIFVAILASGLSQRFGKADKLLARLDDVPLAAYPVSAAQKAGFMNIAAIIPTEDDRRCELFTELNIKTLENDQAIRGQGTSLAVAAQWAINGKAKALLILLADMPFITAEYLSRLVDSYDHQQVVCSFRDQQRMPPVLFASSCFQDLRRLRGDMDGRNYLARLGAVTEIPLLTRMAIDIDTEEMLSQYQGQGLK